MADGTHNQTQRLALIDVSGLYWAAWHSTADMGVSEAFERTIAAVDSYASTSSDLIAVCCDSPPYFRSELLPTYKQHRAEAPPQAREQFERVKARLVERGYLLWGAKGFEADDVIAWAVQRALSDGGISAVTVVTNDKDLSQLVGDRVSCYSPLSRSYMGREAVIDKFGVPPEQMADYLALVGDTSDGIAGVPGVGPKTAAALLASFGSLEKILNESAGDGWEQKFSKPKIRAALVEHADAARLARKLVALRTDVPLDWSELRRTRVETATEPEEMVGEVVPEKPAEPAPMARTEPTALEPIASSATTALAPVTPEWALGLEPVDLAAAYKLAQYLFKSRLYSRFPTAEAIWAVVIRGREMGLGALESLDSFHVVEGRPVPSAHLLIGRAMKHPDCEYFQFLGGDATSAEYEAKRRSNPKPVSFKYTIDQARSAGVLKDKSAWATRPAEMLRKTAGVQLARILFPEIMGSYAVEELS